MNELTQNYVDSISYLEFINNLDDIFYDLLYSPQRGYINLHSKNAVNDFTSYIEKFDWEISKISDKISCTNLAQIVNLKKEEFINELKKHYFEEVKAWAQEVFENLLQNILFSAGLNRDKKENLDILYNRAISAIGWFGDIVKLDKETKNLLVEKFNNDFKDALNSSFSDYAPKQRPNKSNPSLFLKALKIYRDNYDEFMSIEFENTQEQISQEDLAYLNSLRTKSKTSEKNIKDDEVDLINCALSILNLKSDNHKYDFVKQLFKDFDNFNIQNKKITEEDKVLITKRRIELFKDSLSGKQEYKYYKKLLIS